MNPTGLKLHLVVTWVFLDPLGHLVHVLCPFSAEIHTCQFQEDFLCDFCARVLYLSQLCPGALVTQAWNLLDQFYAVVCFLVFWFCLLGSILTFSFELLGDF